MRADRLIAVLLLLQRRGRVTAAEVAEELEVSLRTARRDLESLAMSGVPVYPRRGRGGGWELIGGASTDLTGLSADEARALFLAVGPALTDSAELRMALRKLSAALPRDFQDQAEVAATAVKVDPSGWGRVGTPSQPRFLDRLGQAVTLGRQIELDYESPTSGRRSRTVHPLGLVTKRNVWYLVGSTGAGIRTYRVGRIQDVVVLDEPIERPPGFDLDRSWQDIVTGFDAATTGVTVRVRCRPDLLAPLRWMFGNHFTVVDGPADERTGDDRAAGGRPADERTADERTADERTADERTADERTADERTADERTAGDRGIETRPIGEPGPDDRTGHDRSIEVELTANSGIAFASQVAGFGSGLTLIDPPDEVLVHLARIGSELTRTYGPA